MTKLQRNGLYPVNFCDRIVFINGKGYHVDPENSASCLLDADGKRIPAYICLCHAEEPLDCLCGAWGYGLPEEYYL